MTALLWLALAGCNLRSAPPAYTGTIEVTEIEVASVLAGRITEVRFDEGERVAQGDLVFVLDAEPIEAERDVRAATVDVAQSAIGTASSQVKVAEAQVTWLSREAERAKKMEASGVGTSQQKSSLEGQLAVARAQAAAAREGVATATATHTQAEAALAAAEQRLDETRVAAAVSGVVLSRNREPGEVVAPGTSVLTLGDLDRPRLRVYVPLAVMETLKVGDAVQVKTDAHATAYPGRIARIASEAEFTPRDILTPDERAKRVFAVDVALDPAPGLLPGVPAEAVFGS